MENELNNFISYGCHQNGVDMFCFIFIGHGFGKGPGYLIGSDGQVCGINLKTYYSKTKKKSVFKVIPDAPVLKLRCRTPFSGLG